MEDDSISMGQLELEGMIGFCGGVSSGLHVHPNGQHLIYPVGCTLVIEDYQDNRQEFLSGHTNNVSCLSVSKSGRFVASGQVTHMGFKADVIVWDFQQREMYAKLSLHKGKVEALAFSKNDKYLMSLGGEDDGCVVVWNLATKEAICGSQAQVMSAGTTYTLACANNENVFITGGNETLRVWELDVANRKIRPTDVSMGQLKRVVKCIQVDDNDNFFYCGTTTGDILAVNMKANIFQKFGPEKQEKFSLGVTSISILKTGELLVGSGDGTVCVVKETQKGFKKSNKIAKVTGSITSIALRGTGHQFYIGTDTCNIYKFGFAEFTCELINTCHYAQINDIAFPSESSILFATCSYQDVRIWNMENCQELLRISQPNTTCNALKILRDGSAIITGWDDGRIRGFYPKSGEVLFTINDAHKGGVTALSCFSTNCSNIISGGKEGEMRLWSIKKQHVPKGSTITTKLVIALKEHKASITCIKLTHNDKECVTSSTDGSCIIWDLTLGKRKQMIRVNTLFKYVCYHPQEYQIITTGTDRKVGYWEAYDGSTVRELEASKQGSINAMDISKDGFFFVSAGDDKLVKVWKYDDGEVTHVGVGHSAPITRVMISPCERFLVSVSADGAIMKWKCPFTSDPDKLPQN